MICEVGAGSEPDPTSPKGIYLDKLIQINRCLHIFFI
jgi:hypothetical protein